MPSFTAGNLVQLKSGGPIMTVNVVEGLNVICDWFAGNEHQRLEFPASTLELYDPDETGNVLVDYDPYV
ncbi:MAG: DUF2158 domain-containing protein [Hyphomicrobiales bacterium]